MKIGIVGAGWAGLAAAVDATLAGHEVTVFEAARTVGGRGRSVVHASDADGTPLTLDNGQHIMIGAYSETVALMRTVGADPAALLLRMPLDLRFADGTGLNLPDWPAPLDAAFGIATARGWTWWDRLALLRTAGGWQLAKFRCAPGATVADLCASLTARVFDELIEPLCVSALNTPAARASGQVFLRVMQDSLLGPRGSSNLLIPRVTLGRLFPEPAVAWLADRGQVVRTGTRAMALLPHGNGWQIDGHSFDKVLLACPSWEAARLVRSAGIPADAWLASAEGLQFEAITTVYAHSATRLASPMTALHSNPQAPSQVVFDRRLFAPDRADPAVQQAPLAFVASVSMGTREEVQEQVMAQALGELRMADIAPVFTVVEKRATFACTPDLARPAIQIAAGLMACGEYVEGPYPGTLEGAVRSALQAVRAL